MNRNPLTNEEIQHYAPSAFAGQPYEGQSDRYAFIPTSDVIDAMRERGYFPTMASQSRTRIAGKQNFTKHMLRFRQQGSFSNVGDSAMEMVLINSHDGTSAYKLMLGVFRLVCSNGLVVSESLVQSIRVRHTGNIIEDVVEGTNKLIAQAPIVQDVMNLWKSIQVSQVEALDYAQAALRLRFPEGLPLDVSKLLRVNRSEDADNNLWSIYNRAQEALVRGGRNLRYTTPGHIDETTGNYVQPRRGRVREVKGINENVKLNQALWSLTEEAASLKTGK